MGGRWRFDREFDMTNRRDALVKRGTPTAACRFYEGKMIWQFDHRFAQAEVLD